MKRALIGDENTTVRISFVTHSRYIVTQPQKGGGLQRGFSAAAFVKGPCPYPNCYQVQCIIQVAYTTWRKWRDTKQGGGTKFDKKHNEETRQNTTQHKRTPNAKELCYSSTAVPMPATAVLPLKFIG